MIRLCILVMLCTTTTAAQIELRAGSSDLFESSGASVVFYSPNTETQAGLGLANGNLAFGLSAAFNVKSWTIRGGDSTLYYSTLTAGESFTVRGVEVERGGLSFFAGALGVPSFSPFLQTVRGGYSPGGGVRYQRKIEQLQVFGVAAYNGVLTALEGATLKLDNFRFEETAGILGGQRYSEASAIYQRQHLTASLLHASGTTAEGVATNFSGASLWGSLFQSTGHSGEALGGGLSLGRYTGGAMALFSDQRQIVGTVSERINRHLSANQLIGNGSVSFGGAVLTNSLSVSSGYQEIWLNTTGFEKALNITASLQLPRITLNVGLNVLPGGRLLYTGYGNSFLSAGFSASQQMRDAE